MYRMIKTKTIFIILLMCIFINMDVTAQEESRLGISKSGHYFQYKDKTIMMVGDSGTQCVMQNAGINYRRWIDDCKRVGLNSVHIWSFMAPRQKTDGSVLEERYGYYYSGMTPWARRTTGPLAYDGGYQWDLLEWDDGDDPSHYWSRLRDLCDYAKENEIIVGITVFWGWPKHPGDWQWHPFNINNGGPIEEEVSQYATKVQTISDPDRLIYKEKWQSDWPEAYKNQWLWEKYSDKLLQETLKYGNVFYVFMDEHSYEEGNGGDHFRRMFQDRGALWVDWEARRNDVDAVFKPLNYDKNTGRNKGGVTGFMESPARPFMMLEGDPYLGDKARYAIWTLLIAGGHNIYHNDAGQETPQTGIMGYDPKVTNGDIGSQRRLWGGIASRFFNYEIKNLDEMRPDNSLVSEGSFCLAGRGNEYAIYSMPGTGRTIRLNLTDQSVKYIHYIYDPRTGKKTKSKIIDSGNWIEITKPTDEDWVFHITRME